MAGNIALQTMLPKFDSPFEVQGKALQIQQMQLAQQEAQAQQALQAQARADDAGYRQALQASAGDSTRLLSALASSGNHAGYAKAQAADLAQRKGNADIAKDKATTAKSEWDVLKEANGMVGSAAGALAQQPTYENAQSIVGQLRQRLGPDMSAKLGLDALEIPQDPAQIKAWADQHYMSAIDTDKQLADSRIKSEGVANRDVQVKLNTATNDRIAKEGSLNRANQIAVQDRMTARQSDRLSAPGAEASLSPATLKRLAEMELNGDKSGRTGLGRGAQGAANLTALQNMITDMGAEKGINARDITAASAGLEGLRTGMRATGNISARVENAAEEAAQLAPLALAASKEVSRSGLLPFGKAQDMFDTQTNNPALAKFATANLGLATAYASAMARGNKPTVSDNVHAREMLSTAKDQPAYQATVAQMMQEIEAAKRAPRAVRDSLSSEINGKGGHGAPAPAPPKAGTVQDGWRFKGGDPSNKSNWEKS